MMSNPGRRPRLPVSKVVVEEGAFKSAVEKGRAEPAEIGFFMKGLLRGDVAYVYDLVEFEYEEKSPTFIRSGAERKAMLVGMLPLGLRLIGMMHKHPSSIGARPSWTDERTFMKYAEDGIYVFIIYTVEPLEARAYTVHEGEVVEIGFEARELREEEKLTSFQLTMTVNIRVCVQKSTTLFELKNLLSTRLPYEVEKQTYDVELLLDGEELKGDVDLSSIRALEVKPLRPVDVEASWAPGLFYRFYVGGETTREEIADMLMRALGPGVRIKSWGD